MTSVYTVGTIVAKGVKLVINLAIILIYAKGYDGYFLGIGGEWNLNEKKGAGVEIVASGVMVGFFLYTMVVLISYCFSSLEHKNTSTEAIMNITGGFAFLIVGGMAMHYWVGYLQEHKQLHTPTEQVYGVALGCLCILSSALYFIDVVLSSRRFYDDY